jgi:hypothetical protein
MPDRDVKSDLSDCTTMHADVCPDCGAVTTHHGLDPAPHCPHGFERRVPVEFVIRDDYDRLHGALVKLAGLCIADGEALDRGFLHYAGEFEDALTSRANLAKRLLNETGIPHPPSPYESRGPTDDERRRCARCFYDETAPTTAEHAMCDAEGGHQWAAPASPRTDHANGDTDG